jgi:hypothetical protein
VTLRNPAAYKANDTRWKTIAIEPLRCERFSGFHRGKEEFYGAGGVVSHLYVTSDTTIYIGKCVSGVPLQLPQLVSSLVGSRIGMAVEPFIMPSAHRWWRLAS